ncbi:MAG TPA: lytic transglycosylase domain-containing protein [Thermoanaerobaculia bacterium]
MTQRIARHVSHNGVALLIGLPLALGAIGIPIEAMNTAIAPSVRQKIALIEKRARSEFRIFTTPLAKAEFLAPETAPTHFTVDVAKEQFFAANVPYGAIIYREAERNHLPPELVAAVVQAESDFRVRLVSEKQATGLMQIVPSTGRDLGVSDLFNPAENIAAGTKYLRYLLNRFPDQRIALAAYNAGEGVVERCNCIPEYAETREYVERVNDHLLTFRRQMHGTYLASMRLEPPR